MINVVQPRSQPAPRRVRWEAAGVDGGGNAWSCSGEMESLEDFPTLIQRALAQAFQDLTGGRASYGQPGAGGCRGPYKFRKLLVEWVE